MQKNVGYTAMIILGATEQEYRKATFGFFMSVRPSVRVEPRYSHSTDFHEILYTLFLLKFIDIFQFLLKQDKNNRHVAWRPTNNYVIGIHNTVYAVR